MAPVRDLMQEWDLSHLKETLLLKPQDKYWLHDASFYPYTASGTDPVFAIASNQHVLIYRICQQQDESVQLIRELEDEEKDERTCCLAWSRDEETGAPIICTAGGNAKIKIRDAITGKLRITLVGHGGCVNDLAVSPTNPYILASASADDTVRVWSLDPAHKEQPCAIICAGEGHSDIVLSIGFHATGRYILSGGQDHVINLWVLPAIPKEYAETKEPIVLHYPHFSTSEIHSNIIDCVRFHGDHILSKAFNECCIVLWRIKGFNSASPAPRPSSAPSNHKNQRGTRSAFSKPPSSPDGSRQYVRVVQFDVPGCSELCMRFGLSSPQGPRPAHPILAISNSLQKVFFWDLARLNEYYSYTTSANEFTMNEIEPLLVAPEWLPARRKRGPHTRQVSECATAASASTPTPTPTPARVTSTRTTIEPSENVNRKYAMCDPLKMLMAHRTITLPKFKCNGQQVAWSVCEKWCVVAAAPNFVVIFRKGTPSKGKGVDRH